MRNVGTVLEAVHALLVNATPDTLRRCSLGMRKAICLADRLQRVGTARTSIVEELHRFAETSWNVDDDETVGVVLVAVQRQALLGTDEVARAAADQARDLIATVRVGARLSKSHVR